MQADEARLRHMLDAANDAVAFVRGRSRQDLDQDRQLVLALVKSIEIIGEAAARISESVKDDHPEIPWPSVVAMRNRLIHAYFDVDATLVWDTVSDDLPTLVAQLNAILNPDRWP